MLLLLAAVVSFPGPVHEARSPTSRASVLYREHVDHDGAQDSPVFLDDGRGHRRRLGTITRNMDVGWAPDGRRFFIQDNWGSNVADCYLFERRGLDVRRTTVLKLVQRTPGHPAGTESPGRSHYYVTCERWRSVRFVLGRVYGHTDEGRLHGFDHPFVVDTHTSKLRWLEARQR